MVSAVVPGVELECDVSPSQQTPAPASNRTSWTLDASILRLRNNAGDAFEEFIKDFEKYAYEVTDDVLKADASNILEAKGRAQMARKLLQMFRDTYSK